jgi:plasmid maintenance system antidote protein VapI
MFPASRLIGKIYLVTFSNSADFWMGIQDEFDLREELPRIRTELNKILKVTNLHCLQN